jgi:DNA ligase-associated metallophosphoesterase
MLNVELGGQRLVLLPQKAVLLPHLRTLLVADAHIGKAVSFRRLGVPVPRGTTGETLGALSALVERHKVAHVVFLGDFLHSAHAHAAGTLAAAARWRDSHPTLELTLVRGNHDNRAGDPPPSLRIACVDEPLRLGGLALCHHPRPRAGEVVLAGHLHPCVSAGRGLDRLRLACFHWRADVLVLPAFGAFTGMHPIDRTPGDRVFVAADGTVAELPSRG